METQVLPDPQLNLDFRVDAFEEARRIDPGVDLANFLPPREHPRYLSSLAELIRVELDQDWTAACPKPLESYCSRFPELKKNTRLMQEIAFEEYRLRRQAGEKVSPDDYREQFKIDAGSWPLLPEVGANLNTIALDSQGVSRDATANLQILQDVHPSRRTPQKSAAAEKDRNDSEELRELERERPETAKKVKKALSSLPEVGADFLGFRLVGELGRGTFGRVFLAQQTDLAERFVALKVAKDIFEESQTLAQLQHTNIVPIYSFHRVGMLQAVCMPYFGSTTLAHVLEHIGELGDRPISGKDLISTFNGRRSATQGSTGSPSSSVGQGSSVIGTQTPALPAVSQREGNRPSDAWKAMEGMSFADAALWLSVGIVSGLAHAHEHGVLHRDLKPANILLTDDGTPMLLDFNLAVNSEIRSTPAAARIGGTLPYMAPEQMRAFQGMKTAPDERSDIWSVGVIMYNLFTGRHPYASYSGRIDEIIDSMIEDRSRPAPSLRKWNAAVTPSLEAIVRRCLEPSTSDRYQSARDLHEDLERQLTHRPLKHTREPSRRERFAKWRRRHPRLTSSSAIAAVGFGLLVTAGGVALAANERMCTLHARTEFAAHRGEFQSIQSILYERSPSGQQLDDGLKRGAAELDRYAAAAGLTPEAERKPDMRYLDESQRLRLKEDIGELYFLMAKATVQKAERTLDPAERDLQLCSAQRWNELAESSSDRLPRSVREQRADLLKLKGMRAEEQSLRDLLRDALPQSARDRYLLGQWLVKEGRYREALPHLIQSTQEDPENFPAWMVRGNAHIAVDQPDFAVAAFSAAIALRPDYAPAWLNRGLAYGKLHFHELALADFDRAIELDADRSEAYIQRAFARQEFDRWGESIADLSRALECSHCSTRAWFMRSIARQRTGDWVGAVCDWARGLVETPNDALSFVARAERRLDQPEAALADIEAALRIDAISAEALQLKAHVLSERMNKPSEAMAVLDRTIEVYPDSAINRVGRGVVLARQGKRPDAVRDAEDALIRDTKAPIMYMAACIYALTTRQERTDRFRALELLSNALQRGFGLDIVDTDTDLDPIRGLPEFKKIVAAAKELAISRRTEPTNTR